MKVVLYTSGFFEYVVELANSLANRPGLEVHLLISDKVDPEILGLLDDRISATRFRNVDYVSYRQNLRWLLSIRRELTRIRPDIVHVQTYGHPWFFWLYLSFPFWTFVNTVHDPIMHSGDLPSIVSFRRFRWATPFLNFISRAVFVHGQVLRREFCQVNRFAPERVHVIPHGEFSCYSRLSDGRPFSEHEDYILFFGRIWPYKGLDLFLKAGLKVIQERPAARFLVAGKGENLEQYREIVSEHPEHFLFFDQRIEGSRVASLFERALFVVLPYRDATQSGVIATAFALKKTVVATNVGALSEAVETGHDGILVQPEDIDSLAAAILELYDSSELRERLSRNALQSATTKLSWENVGITTHQVYQRL